MTIPGGSLKIFGGVSLSLTIKLKLKFLSDSDTYLHSKLAPLKKYLVTIRRNSNGVNDRINADSEKL
jgi:hypothetical protein